MRRAKFAALHADTLGRVDAPEQAALVIGDDLHERHHAVPASRPDSQQQTSFTPLARHRGQLLPPGWQHEALSPAPMPAAGIRPLGGLREADIAAVSALLLARLRRKARDVAPQIVAGPLHLDVAGERSDRLRRLADRTGRSCHELIAEAIDHYLSTADTDESMDRA